MIKVFTTSASASAPSPHNAGDQLTNDFREWVRTFEPYNVEIINFHTNSNKFGYMLTVHYKVKR